MKEITKVFNVYEFSELNEDAKAKVKDLYLEGQDEGIFSDICKEKLKYSFPNSDLSVSYQLSYSQGDGLRFDGYVCPSDFIEDKTQEEKELASSFGNVKIYGNNRYFHFNKNDYNFPWTDEYSEMTKENQNFFDELESIILYTLENLSKEFMEDGYNYFYEIEYDDLEDICDTMEYLFTENGEFFDYR